MVSATIFYTAESPSMLAEVWMKVDGATRSLYMSLISQLCQPPLRRRRAPWDNSAAATAAAAATARLPGAIPKAIAKKRAQFEAEQAEKARNAALGVRLHCCKIP